MDCGPTCLRMVAKFYGKSYSVQYLRSRSYITRAGVSMLGISDAAESIGFRTKGYRLSWEDLSDEVPLPCIVHWKQHHFVVVYKIKKIRNEVVVFVADPAVGLLKYKKDEFLKCWISTKQESEEIGTALLLALFQYADPTTNTFYKSVDAYSIINILNKSLTKLDKSENSERIVRMLNQISPNSNPIIFKLKLNDEVFENE